VNTPPKLWLPYIAMGIIPGVIWLLYFLRKDRQNPEPKGKIFQVFLWGMLATVPAVVIEIFFNCLLGYSCSIGNGFSIFQHPIFANILISNLIAVFIITATVEELAKYCVVKSEVLNNKNFDEPVDAMIYCITAALGFASAENILFVFMSPPNTAFVTAIMRFFSAILLHALAGGFMGYFIGKVKAWEMKQNQLLPGIRKTRRAFKYKCMGIITAILLHGSYNFLIITNTKASFAGVIVLILTAIIVLSMAFKHLKQDTFANNKAFGV